MESNNKGIYILAVLGVLLGFSLDMLWRNQVSQVFYYSLFTLFALLYGLAFNNKHSVRLIFSSFFTALILSLPILPIDPGVDRLSTEQVMSMLALFPIFTYVGHSFHCAYHQGSSWKLNYSNLYAAVWNTIPLLIIASFFLCLTHLLIMLTAYIFKTANIRFLYDLYFYNEHFLIILNSTLFFIGLGIGQQSLKMVYNLTHLLARMMHYLYPFLAGISVLYFVLYWVHVLSGGKEFINPLIILTPLVILGVIFFNGSFQDGKNPSEYSVKLNVALKFYRVILLFLAMMFSYQLFQEVSLPINAALFLVVVILNVLAYAVTTVMHEKQEREMIRQCNIAIALFFVVGFLSLNNPIKPVNLVIGKDGLRLGTITKPLITLPKVDALTPGAKQTIEIKDKQQKIDQLLQEVGLYWENNPSSQTYNLNTGTEQVSICRAMYKNGYQIGVFKNKQCQITFNGKALISSDYQLLASKEDILTWSKVPSELMLGVEFKPQYIKSTYDSSYRQSNINSLTACLVEVDGKLYLGKSVYQSCMIALDGKEKTYHQFKRLNLKPKALSRYLLKHVDTELNTQGYHWKNKGSEDTLVAGYMGGEPISICRAHYNNGYLVGQFLNGQCQVSENGKALTVDEFQILAAADKEKMNWQSGYDYMPIKHSYLATGFEFTNLGAVSYLYSCRTIYDNQIHVGKLIDGKCRLAVDGDEVVGQGMQIFSNRID